MTTPEDLPRSLELEGATNVRDLGGWRTTDGRRVRFGHVYRAAALHRITDADVAALAATGLRTICDLRGEAERLSAPSRLAGVTVHALSIEPSLGVPLRDIAARREVTDEDVMGLMRGAYAAYALEWSHRYRALFDLLLAEEGPPLLFHCTAGKDRTGFGAALLLTALGVEEEAVREDYLATNRLWRADSTVAAMLPEAVARVLLSVHADMLDAAFSAIHEAHGSIDAYLADRLGLDDGRLEVLRTRLLE